MALNLKRKREKDNGPRKARKLSPDEDLLENASFHSDNEEDPESEMDDDVPEANDEEDQEWGGISDPQQNGQMLDAYAFGSNIKKPTGEELRNIKNASELFRSNTFKFQIDELLPHVRPKTKKAPPLERFLHSLHTFLSKLPDVPPKHPLEAARSLLKKGVSVPYSAPLPTEDTNWKVAFSRPSEITLVGSWANKISVKAQDNIKYGVDLAVEMPSSLFQEKDHLNGRFFHKKAFYLANIAAAINDPKSGLNVEASYVSTGDDPRLTKLVLEPRADDSPNDFTKLKARVYIIPVLSPDSPIPIHRLSPAHANLRVTSEDAAEGEDAIKLPTPLYNTTILTSATPRLYLLSTHTLQQNTLAFTDAITLLRVWANQRRYGEGTGTTVRGFDGKGPWWIALLGCLIMGEEPSSATKSKSIKRKPVGRGLSSYQLFRAALDFLSKHDFESEPVFVKAVTGHKFLPDEYQSNHDAVFVDSSSMVNLLAGVPIGSLKLLAIDARKTLEILNHSSSANPFPEVFMKDHRDLQTRFDAVVHVDLSSVKPRKTSMHQILDTGSAANALMASLSSLLSQGLGDRVKAVTLLHPTPTTRPLSQAHPSSSQVVHIGLVYDAQNAFRQVDRGPPATESDTSLIERFREFWGDKAELRRFKDGSIIESVVWDVKTVDEKAHIPTMVVRHILKYHFGLEDNAVHAWQTPFDSLLRLPESISRFYVGSGLSMGFKGAITAFDDIIKNIKSFDEQNILHLMNVSAASESLRYTSVFSPVPLPPSIASALPPNARYLHPIEIVLEFERSTHWPDDLRAIQKVKWAVFERIADCLMKTPGLKASVVLGDGVTDSEIQDNARLEIVTSDGWAFSARIWLEREAILLDNIINDTGDLPHVKVKSKERKKGKEYHDAVRAREAYTKRFIHAPQHHRAIAKICHHFLAFAGTVRLVKRWFASHWLLHGHVSEEVVELLCVQFFVTDGWDEEVEKDSSNVLDRINVPGSKERGFASVIQFLKDWKWEEGLFVPLYSSSMKPVTQPKAVTSAGNGVWKVSTKMDEEGLIWTLRGPDAIVARRVQALAQATWECLQGMERSGKLVVQSMFDHPTNDYNFVIKLDPAVLPRYHQNVLVDAFQSSRGKYSNEAQATLIRPGFDPAQALFEDLQRVYQDTFRIFYDPFGGDRYGAVWDPTLKEPRPFRVMGGFSSVPSSEDSDSKSGKKTKDLVSLNEQGVLEEVERLGRGIIRGIAVHV